MPEQRPVGVDLFCGAGGMSLGFEQAGFDIVAAVDVDPIHVATHTVNFPDCKTICADLSTVSGRQLRERALLGDRQLDVVFGGSPCQGFSTIGRRDPKDPRNALLDAFARLVDDLRPLYFVLENVEGLRLGESKAVLEAFAVGVRRAGYEVVDPVQALDASDFGVPQRRSRLFILGYQVGLPAPSYPIGHPQTDQNAVSSHPTVWDAIGDLALIDDRHEFLDGDVYSGPLGEASDYARILRGEVADSSDRSRSRPKSSKRLSGCRRSSHSPDTIRRFTATAPGTRERVSRFYRLSKEGLAPTLRAGTNRDYGSFTAPRPIHPLYPRCITVREAARLHSFPDWFEFHGTIWHGFRQVGNAVPPLLARAVARSVLRVLGEAKVYVAGEPASVNPRHAAFLQRALSEV